MSKATNKSNTKCEAKKTKTQEARMITCMKYENYKTQFERLKKAMANHFYLEAIVIEYAIMEDRTAAILSYEGNDLIPKNEKDFISITQKIKKIVRLAENKNSVIGRYFAKDLKDKRNLLDEIVTWLNNDNHASKNSVCRNSIIHNLLGIITTTENLHEIAEQGHILCRDLTDRANNYKRMIERRKAKQEGEAQSH